MSLCHHADLNIRFSRFMMTLNLFVIAKLNKKHKVTKDCYSFFYVNTPFFFENWVELYKVLIYKNVVL